RRRDARVPAAGPGPRPRQVPAPEGAPLPQPVPGAGDHARLDARRPDPRPGDRLRRRRRGGVGVARRWECLEPGCGVTLAAASDDELVAAVHDHVREAHDSYELEEIILAAAEGDEE